MKKNETPRPADALLLEIAHLQDEIVDRICDAIRDNESQAIERAKALLEQMVMLDIAAAKIRSHALPNAL